MTAIDELVVKIMTEFDNTGIKKGRAEMQRLNATFDQVMRKGNMLRKQPIGFKNIDDMIDKTELAKRGFRVFGDASRTLRGRVVNNLNRMGKAMDKWGSDFRMAFLGVMFFGMMIQRAFQRLAMSSVSAFMEVTKGATEAGKGINMLKGSWELLKFSIGSAIADFLLPFIPLITRIVEKISDWIQDHKDLVGWIVVGGIALGGFLFLLGSFALGLTALVAVIGKTITVISWLGMAFTLLEGIAVGTVLAWVGIIIAILVVLWAAWKTNFGGIRDFVKETFGIIWEVIKGTMKDIWGIIKDILGIVVAIFKGDWDKVWVLTKDLLKRLARIFFRVLIGLGFVVKNVFVFIIKIVADSVVSIMKLFLWLDMKAKQLFWKLGRAIVKALADPLQQVINKINGWIDRVSKFIDIGFRLPNITSIMDTMTNKVAEARTEYEKNSASLDKWKDKLLSVSGIEFMTKDQFKDTLAETFDKLNLNIEAQKENLATTEQVTEANNKEAESWYNKANAINEVISRVREANELGVAGGITSNLDFRRSIIDSS